MQRSDSIASLAAALSKAQSRFSGAKMDSDNPFFKSKYADLASVWDAVRGPLTDNGLSVCQMPKSGEEGTLLIETLLMHNSGEWLAYEFPIPITKKDPQAYGSSVTYGRRYALQAILSVPAVDDDAEGAMMRKGNGKQTQSPPQQRSIDVDSEYERFRKTMDKSQTLTEAANHFRTYAKAMKQLLGDEWQKFELYKNKVKDRLSKPKPPESPPVELEMPDFPIAKTDPSEMDMVDCPNGDRAYVGFCNERCKDRKGCPSWPEE